MGRTADLQKLLLRASERKKEIEYDRRPDMGYIYLSSRPYSPGPQHRYLYQKANLRILPPSTATSIGACATTDPIGIRGQEGRAHKPHSGVPLTLVVQRTLIQHQQQLHSGILIPVNKPEALGKGGTNDTRGAGRGGEGGRM